MIAERLMTEAEKCRSLARVFEGRPEQPFLLKIAETFEDLARPQATRRRS